MKLRIYLRDFWFDAEQASQIDVTDLITATASAPAREFRALLANGVRVFTASEVTRIEIDI